MSELKKRTLKAITWNYFGKLAKNASGLIVMIILARLLQPSDFGLIAIIMVLITFSMLLTEIGLGDSLIQKKRLLPVHYNSVFYVNLILGLLLTVITFFLAKPLANFYENNALIPITQVLSIIFLINSFNSVQIYQFRKELNYAIIAKADIGSSLLSGIISIILAYAGYGVWSLVSQAISRSFFNSIFLWSFSTWRPALMFSFKALRQLWSFGLNIFLAELIERLISQLDIIIIGKIFSPAILGFYDQAKRLNSMVIQYSSSALMSVLFPVLSSIKNDRERLKNIVVKAFSVLCFIVFILLGILYVSSDEIIIIIFTEKWLPASEYFKLFLLSGYMYPLSAILVNILTSQGNSKLFLKLKLLRFFLILITFYIGFQFGLIGFLYSMAIFSFLYININMYFSSKQIQLNYRELFLTFMSHAILAIIGILLISILYTIKIYPIVDLTIKSLFYIVYFLAINKLLKMQGMQFALELFLKRKKR
ncbi:MAG: lipopolysaccharide biosynthesis protein [Sulfuricurvum sp.]|uniref:lipopolysaccharide biosynthesis protein n=1 Tax=Sulfuricurvum sp. TaxID=2025608 RepID=UPI002616E90F|nr:lipopolysaccharide biosynthesis protein [Sulfuricurvum sp.]MDD2367686.1 lipopolysaccharide biosynthesis protein [Sulfuricurvum sp.]MDD2949354.1 lipopolysaccharide biosynthesis protein [Sulfuricurvum sp.]MDD5118611.1 lipopolysaccharide biosynthesis protein [Sulfuricurvum sp.]